MDPTALAGMLFVLLLAAMLGGFVLLFPISRRLGLLLEQRMAERKGPAGIPAEELRELRGAVQALQAQLEELAARQEFTESLLSERRPLELPMGDPGKS